MRIASRSEADNAGAKKLFQKELEIVRAMQKTGVPILAGTDTGNPFCFPGFSLHEELALLVIADLVLLGANPLEDIRNTQRIKAVVSNGWLFDRKALDELLAYAEGAAKR